MIKDKNVTEGENAAFFEGINYIGPKSLLYRTS
jgi:hypothetical protein